MKHLLLFLSALLLSVATFATHNMAGDITYTKVGGNTYEFTITIFADNIGGRDAINSNKDIEVFWGDGQNSTLTVISENPVLPDNSVLKRIWRTTHTFPGPGSYTVRIEDPNRNSNVVNMSDSRNTPFTISSKIRVLQFSNQANNSVQLRNDPIDNACAGARYVYNPGAFDVDGDALVYELAESRGRSNQIAAGYTFPSSSDTAIYVNKTTGDLVWHTPNAPGVYNVGILIREYRNGVEIGNVLRDLQIIVKAGCVNQPPVITAQSLYCVSAGDTLTAPISASDPDLVDKVSLSAQGLILEPPINTGGRVSMNFGVVGNPSNASLIWRTLCSDVRQLPYRLSIKALDDASNRSSENNDLAAYHTMRIRIVAPAPENVTATANGRNIILNWDNTSCQNAIGYHIYRRIDSSGFVPNECQIGVPDNIGYTRLTSITGLTNTSFIDDNNGEGLIPGQRYCYLVTKHFDDGDESYASEEVCARIKKVVPVITNVSIDSTHPATGMLTIRWSQPDTIDPLAFPPPYRYLIYEAADGANSFTLIDSTNSLSDTVYKQEDLNTLSSGYRYRINLFSYGNGKTSVGPSVNASSMLLSVVGTDNTNILSWTDATPWSNFVYVVYRKTSGGSFTPIGTSTNLSYTDNNLSNGQEYCYYIESRGNYDLSIIPDTLINFSQRLCSTPEDDVAPCAPQLYIEANCSEDRLRLEWNDLLKTCGDDVASYQIYRADSRTDTMTLFASIPSALDTTFEVNGQSIAGCYAISAIDSTGNESALSDSSCVNYCPEYELPNVFTPNGDGKNDFFIPIQPYRDVDSIDLVIINRWGEKVFTSSDPDIKWNGVHRTSGELVSSGVYFYTCVVYEKSLKTRPDFRILKGTLTILNPKKSVDQK
jgi:gliding motility-associated-like protein